MAKTKLGSKSAKRRVAATKKRKVEALITPEQSTEILHKIVSLKKGEPGAIIIVNQDDKKKTGSMNLFGGISPTTAAQTALALLERVDEMVAAYVRDTLNL